MSTLFAPTADMGTMAPRPYQQEALDALDRHVCEHTTNPCVVIPTGGGKSILIAWSIQRWKVDYPPFRCCILAHRKELVQQNSAELIGLWPGGDIGVFSAGLGKRDWDCSILYASIDSIWDKSGSFTPFDCLIIDEAHRIPAKGEGKYRKFIDGCRRFNPKLRVIGFTATPYRMGCGPICHQDHILHDICYEANIGQMIHDGYLCRLRSKVSARQPDLSQVKRNRGGDYVEGSLAEAVDVPAVVSEAVREMMRIVHAEQRQSIIVFCVDIDHCKHVSQELRKYGIDAPYVTAKTPAVERDRIAEAFKRGRHRILLNVNVYTEGFNAKCVDCVVLLRPTLSQGLYVQMVGRGLRLHPGKDDCLVLDFAHCIEQHGPIDAIDAGVVRLADCQNCGDTFSRAVRMCPHCGWTIPPEEIERVEAEEARERQMHAAKASDRSILSEEPDDLEVSDVTVHRHIKQGSPDSIRVQYRCGLTIVREWVCLDHGGYAEAKARQWWARRFGSEAAPIVTVDSALADLFLAQQIQRKTKAVRVARQGKHLEIIGYRFA